MNPSLNTHAHSPLFTGPVWTFFILSWGGLLLACERPQGAYDFVDEPLPPPIALVESTEKDQEVPTPATPPSLQDCGWDTGRNAAGTCVPLHVRSLPYGQRIQIPQGRMIMGFVPLNYNARDSRQTPVVRWSGQPPHYVEVDSFFIDLFEVTHEAYQACVDAKKCSPSPCPAGQQDPFANLPPELANVLPQTCVTHVQAQTYCEANGGRLPTEAEWEYAARGTDDRRYPWGSQIDDSLPSHLYPAGQLAEDRSYFGILGMGSNAYEWVADEYEAESALKPFLQGEFRDAEGPLATHRKQFESQLYCPNGQACSPASDLSTRYVYKGWMIGSRRAARKHLPKQPTAESELEGWPLLTHSNQIGFRCAADLDPQQDEALRVPTSTAFIPLTYRNNDLLIFGGVAEAVTQQEAQQFCQQLTVPIMTSEQSLSDWRLPNLAEIRRIAPAFRGPGPFWTQDGGIFQESGSWQLVSSITADEPLAARCIHDPR